MKIKPPFPGWERQFVRCRYCGRVYTHDFQPFSLSNPVLALPCNHDVGRRNATEIITGDELALLQGITTLVNCKAV